MVKGLLRFSFPACSGSAPRALRGAVSAAPDHLDRAALQLAALYHDAIYDSRAVSPANEVASAELAASVATDLGWSAQRVALVHRLRSEEHTSELQSH